MRPPRRLGRRAGLAGAAGERCAGLQWARSRRPRAPAAAPPTRDLATSRRRLGGKGLLIGRYAGGFRATWQNGRPGVLTVDDVTRRAHYRNAYGRSQASTSAPAIVNENTRSPPRNPFGETTSWPALSPPWSTRPAGAALRRGTRSTPASPRPSRGAPLVGRRRHSRHPDCRPGAAPGSAPAHGHKGRGPDRHRLRHPVVLTAPAGQGALAARRSARSSRRRAPTTARLFWSPTPPRRAPAAPRPGPVGRRGGPRKSLLPRSTACVLFVYSFCGRRSFAAATRRPGRRGSGARRPRPGEL